MMSTSRQVKQPHKSLVKHKKIKISLHRAEREKTRTRTVCDTIYNTMSLKSH